MQIDYIKLSKIISHALRHEPENYNLKLDEQGWVSLTNLIDALQSKGFEVNKDIIITMIEISEKKRHQILDDKIRAYYGHSTNEKIIKLPKEPPNILYHGTTKDNVLSILERGLDSMNRQYVHLSTNKEMAEAVAKRRKGKIFIFEVWAKSAYCDGVEFYKEENEVWLVNHLSPKYINLCNGIN